MDYVDRVTLNDLDEEKRQLAELIGIENYRKILRVYPGGTLYIPKMDDIRLMIRNEKIRKEFNGKNYNQLAGAFDLSERTIRDIVYEEKRRLKMKPLEGQIKFNL